MGLQNLSVFVRPANWPLPAKIGQRHC